MPGLRTLTGRGLAEDEIELGSISGIFGVSGEVRLFLHNRESDLLAQPREVVLVAPDGRRHAATLSARPGAGKRILGRLAGLTRREDAETLQDWTIGIAERDLPTVSDDEFYVYQLEGATVFVADQAVGEVVAVHSTPQTDILEVRAGEEVHFVPCLSEFVLELGPGRVVLSGDALAEEP